MSLCFRFRPYTALHVTCIFYSLRLLSSWREVQISLSRRDILLVLWRKQEPLEGTPLPTNLVGLDLSHPASPQTKPWKVPPEAHLVGPPLSADPQASQFISLLFLISCLGKMSISAHLCILHGFEHNSCLIDT